VDERVKSVLENFDFRKVNDVMIHLDWKWSRKQRVPTIGELFMESQKLLEEVVVNSDEHVCVSTGGFEAEKFDGEVSLKFIVEEWGALAD